MEKTLLQKVNSPKDLKKFKLSELKEYSGELRTFITETVLSQGGHLSSNLGSIELAIALHYVFDSPTDKLLWDVGHQSYAHKIITGRREGFKKLRTNDGVKGFPNPAESEHDSFVMGHSSTSLSVALGFCHAKNINNCHHNVISIIGDGAFTGGMAFEALNDIGMSRAKMIIILNDNEMSISKSVGAVSDYLAKLRLSKRFSNIKYNIKKGLCSMPFFGGQLVSGLEVSKKLAKSFLPTNKMFEQMGIKYYGPLDGHNIANMIDVFKSLKNVDSPVLVHLLTSKGKGYYEAEINPGKYHGVNAASCAKEDSFSTLAGEKLLKMAETNPKITAVTAAMCDGTGLKSFADKYPARYFDVGIAEQHAVTMAAGQAKQGLKPYFAVYSSFLQRAYDQLIHDVCISNLPVTLLVDRAGVIGSDGITHQGVFDLGYLKMMPNMTVLTPKDGKELEDMIEFSETFNAPLAIRYPKCYFTNYDTHSAIKTGEWEVIKKSSQPLYLLCVGNRMLDIASKIENVNIINCRFVKPLDKEFLNSVNKKGNLIITLEDNALMGGFGESVLSYLNREGNCGRVCNLGINDAFIDNLNIDEVYIENGISVENINKIIKEHSVKIVE